MDKPKKHPAEVLITIICTQLLKDINMVLLQGAAAEDDLEEEEIEFSDDEKVTLQT